jgi:hypothetical protein
METTHTNADGRNQRDRQPQSRPTPAPSPAASAGPERPIAVTVGKPNTAGLDQLRGDGSGLLAPDVRAALFALRCG